MVGQTVTCSCSSDITSSSMNWYSSSSLLPLHSGTSSVRSLTIPVTTDIEGEVYTCSMSNSCGDQEKFITVSIIGMCIYVSAITLLTYLIIIPVPDDWATVDITNSTNQNALHNTNYVLTCTVMVIDGMNLALSVEWVGPDGVVVASEGNRTVGQVETQGTTSTLTLSFNPVLSSHGGRYTCRAAISVPWMATQPPQHSTSVDMPVTCESLCPSIHYTIDITVLPWI